MSDWTDVKNWAADKAAGPYDYGIGQRVLALIAENERVKARLCVCRDCGGQGEVYAGHSSYQGHNQPPEPDMDVCGTCGGDGVLGPLEDFEALADERDQLKAENELLQRAGESLKDQAKQLNADNERLAAILAQQKSRRADDDECLSLATQSIDELRKDAERYRWLRDKATGDDWEHIGYQDNDQKDLYVDDYSRHQK